MTSIADAKLDSVPLLAITGQVNTAVIGTDAFQETPIVEVCRSVTKHHYLVTDVGDVARVMREAFYVATTGRPGPVLVDIPKNVQLAKTVADYDVRMNLPGYRPDERRATAGGDRPDCLDLRGEAAGDLRRRRRDLFRGHAELAEFAVKMGIPVAMTLTGLGGFPGDHPLSLDMLGMHGSVYANYAVDNADLLLAFGVRFDDRVTGKVSEFAAHGKIVHVDIDPSEINKIKKCHLAITSDLKYAVGRVEQGVAAAAGIGRMAPQDRRLETGGPAGLRPLLRGHPPAARHPRTVPPDGRSRRR